MNTVQQHRELLRRPDVLTFKQLEIGNVYKRLPSDEHEEPFTVRITKKEELYKVYIDLDREQDYEYGRSPYGRLAITGDVEAIARHMKLYDPETGEEVNIEEAKRGEYRVLLMNPGTGEGMDVIRVEFREPDYPLDFEVLQNHPYVVLDVGVTNVDDVFRVNRIKADVFYTDPVIVISKTFEESPENPRLYIPASGALNNNQPPVNAVGLRKTLKNNAWNRRNPLVAWRKRAQEQRPNSKMTRNKTRKSG